MVRRRSDKLKVQPDGRVRISLSLTEEEARKVEQAAGSMAPGSWCRWAVLQMADRVQREQREG